MSAAADWRGCAAAATCMPRAQPAGPLDRQALWENADRVVAIGIPRWRHPGRARASALRIIDHGLQAPSSRRMVLVARGASGPALGFLRVDRVDAPRRSPRVVQVTGLLVRADHTRFSIARILLEAAWVDVALPEGSVLVAAPGWAEGLGGWMAGVPRACRLAPGHRTG